MTDAGLLFRCARTARRQQRLMARFRTLALDPSLDRLVKLLTDLPHRGDRSERLDP
jgi:hypothetical protein